MSHVLPSRPPSSPPVLGGPARAVIREVGLRDGLQSIATVLATARKIEWIDAAFAADQRETEVGPFVHTEDLACMLERMGAHAGRDMPALLALPQRVAGWLAGEALHGTRWQAGLPRAQVAAAVSAPAAVASSSH